MKFYRVFFLMSILSLSGYAASKGGGIADNIAFARAQIGREIRVIEAKGKFINPVTTNKDGSVWYCSYWDWRSGFFPGSVWYLYELTGDEVYLPLAKKYTEAINQVQNITSNHDVGFMAGCSFGNGFRLTKDSDYEKVLIQSARSLSTRFRPVAGIIQSWDVTGGWMSKRGWECPVIIDNMMNLELLFDATKLSKDSLFWNIAVAHADRTLKEHFRADASCYHVIDYSLAEGGVRNRHTAQGAAHESIWSRGQAWAIYGYVVCYRYTGYKRYIEQAVRTFEMMKKHPNMPSDFVPYWDMDAPNIPNEPRDASSAAVIASALYEMSGFDIPNAKSYKKYADKIIESLSSPVYRAKLGSNGNFLLLHSVGSKPHGAEIDVPLNYADYYFLEALKRKKDIENRSKTK